MNVSLQTDAKDFMQKRSKPALSLSSPEDMEWKNSSIALRGTRRQESSITVKGSWAITMNLTTLRN